MGDNNSRARPTPPAPSGEWCIKHFTDKIVYVYSFLFFLLSHFLSSSLHTELPKSWSWRTDIPYRTIIGGKPRWGGGGRPKPKKAKKGKKRAKKTPPRT